MKRFIFGVIIFLFSIFFSFAEENIQCGGISKPISEWESIVNAVLFGVEIKPKEFEFEKYESVYKRFLENIKFKTKDTFSKIGGYGIGVIWSAMTLLGENVTSPFAVLAVIFKPEEVVNDYKELMILENKIRDFMLQVGKNGRFFDKVSEEEIKKINNKLKDGLIKFEISNGITYGNLGSLIYMFNFVYKNIVLYASYGSVNNIKSNIEKVKRYIKNICKGRNVGSYCKYIKSNKIELNETKYDSLVNRYSECKFGSTNLINRFKNLAETFSGDVRKVLKKFPDSLKRLDEALEGFKKDIKDKSLLGENGWINFRSNITFSDLGKKVSNKKENDTKGFSDFEVKKQDIFKIDDGGKKKIINTYKSDYSELKKEILRKQILQSFEFVENLQREFLLDNASTDTMTSILTRKYVFLSRAIHYNIILIGDKGKEETIIDKLGKACEKQCSNVGGICWYF